jgi:putative NADH-flavin reductase
MNIVVSGATGETSREDRAVAILEEFEAARHARKRLAAGS